MIYAKQKDTIYINKLKNTLNKSRDFTPLQYNLGFTIVELLVVIVVIGILAAITIVSYSGVTQKAIDASSLSDLSHASTVLELYKAQNGLYPISLDNNNCPSTPLENINSCLKKSSDKLVYTYSSDGTSFTLDAVYGTEGIFYTVSNGTSPIKLNGGWLQVSNGYEHTCAIAINHQAYCWGRNSNYRLGDGTATTRLVPTAIVQGDMPSLKVKSVYTGNNYSCAINNDEQAYCWGGNNYGQLGNSTVIEKQMPTAISQGEMPSSKIIKSLSLGDFHVCAISIDDQIYCWGANTYGQLGNGTANHSSIPVAVTTSMKFKEVSAGSRHTCAINKDNQAYCWGSNFGGQLGDGTTDINRVTPVAVLVPEAGMESFNMKSISAGYIQTCAISDDNQAYCWGDNNKLKPTAITQGQILGLSIKSIFASRAGLSYVCAIASDNHIYCWGSNYYGQLGDGTTVNKSTPNAVAQGEMSSLEIKTMSIGYNGNCTINKDFQMFCWGNNARSQIGDNTTINRLAPTAVVSPF